MQYKVVHDCMQSHYIKTHDGSTLIKDIFPCEGCPTKRCGIFTAGETTLSSHSIHCSEKYLLESLDDFIQREQISTIPEKKFKEAGIECTIPEHYYFRRWPKAFDFIEILPEGHDTFSLEMDGFEGGVVSRSELEELRDALNKTLEEHPDA